MYITERERGKESESEREREREREMSAQWFVSRLFFDICMCVYHTHTHTHTHTQTHTQVGLKTLFLRPLSGAYASALQPRFLCPGTHFSKVLYTRVLL